MKIAVSSIIKNEIKFIKKYLKRNKNADYICLLDTGSTDGTWEYLQEQNKSNSKLIIKQILYDNFRFDIARNDSLKLIPDDVNIIINLDLDEYFSDKNWRGIIEKNILIDGNLNLYSLLYEDYSDFSITEYPRMLIACRMFQTKKVKFFNCVHECLADSTWENNGFRKEFPKWNKLLIIHDPDKSKTRKSYISLCEQRCLESDNEMNLLESKIFLFYEYYKNNLYNDAIKIYNEINDNNKYDLHNKNFFLYNISAVMYKITNDINYIRKFIKELYLYSYEQHLLYFALKDDLEWCKQYKDGILKKIEEHNNELEERFKKYDILGNKIEEMSREL